MRNLMWALAIIVGLAYGVAHVVRVQTPMPMAPEMQQLLNHAVKFSGRPLPLRDRPEVVFVSPSQMGLLMCGNTDPDCPVEGVYFGGNKVFVITGLKDVQRRSIIVHEFVHWLQRQQNGKSNSCLVTAKQEAEAYRVQNRYLKTVEGNTNYVYPPLVVCQ